MRGGDIVPDPSKRDGTPRKLMSSAKLEALGVAPEDRVGGGDRIHVR